MMNLTPFLLFDGNCAEAMAFYQSCLGGDLSVTKVGDTPMKGQVPPGQHQKVAYAHLKSGTIELSATDWLHPTRAPKQGNTVAMYVNGGHGDIDRKSTRLNSSHLGISYAVFCLKKKKQT